MHVYVYALSDVFFCIRYSLFIFHYISIFSTFRCSGYRSPRQDLSNFLIYLLLFWSQAWWLGTVRITGTVILFDPSISFEAVVLRCQYHGAVLHFVDGNTNLIHWFWRHFGFVPFANILPFLLTFFVWFFLVDVLPYRYHFLCHPHCYAFLGVS